MRPPDHVGTPPADSRGTEAWQPICKRRFAAPRTPSAAHHCGQHFDAHPDSAIFAPGQHNLHTQAVQPFGQTVASDRRPFRPDRLDEQPNASGGVPFEQPAVSHGLPRQASRTDPRFLAARRFGRHTEPPRQTRSARRLLQAPLAHQTGGGLELPGRGGEGVAPPRHLRGKRIGILRDPDGLNAAERCGEAG